jgi:hypothetical protein
MVGALGVNRRGRQAFAGIAIPNFSRVIARASTGQIFRPGCQFIELLREPVIPTFDGDARDVLLAKIGNVSGNVAAECIGVINAVSHPCGLMPSSTER